MATKDVKEGTLGQPVRDNLGREASRMPAAAAHTPAEAFQPQAGARTSLLGTKLRWLLLVFCRAKGSEDGGKGRTVCPSMPAVLSPQPGSAVWALGLPHHPPREQDLSWTLSSRQYRKAGRRAVGGALQREPRPDCATCRDVSASRKPSFCICQTGQWCPLSLPHQAVVLCA